MRIAIINHCHPDAPHVCAWRARAFSEQLVDLGHDVLLITAPLDETRPGENLATLARHIHNQRNTGNYRHIALGNQRGSSLPAIRSGRIPTPFRQIAIATQFALHGNIFFDWVRSVGAALPIVAEEFRANIVWAIFGNSACWVIGQQLAQLSACPWVGDLKDSWPRFIPNGFRRLTAQRFKDTSRITAFSKAHADEVQNYMGLNATVIYSGIPEHLPDSGIENSSHTNDVLITGSLYDQQRLVTFIDGLKSCLASRRDVQDRGINLVYAGNDASIFDAAVEQTKPGFPIERCGSLPTAQLADRQRSALLNVYIRHAPNLFHHKLFELLAAGRPVISVGGETSEAIAIAAESGTPFHACATFEELNKILPDTLIERAGNNAALSRFSTKNQARLLADLLVEAVASQGNSA
jgi:hypothetical protein